MTARPTRGPAIPGEVAIRGAYGTTTSVREVGEMDFFLIEGMGGEHVASEGPTTSTGSGPTRATAA